MKKDIKNILITGGAGFIGSHVVRHFVNRYPGYHIYNLDALTYAGNLENITDIQDRKNYTFIKADIRNDKHIQKLFNRYHFDAVIHLAAESHVDRSIENPNVFIETNVLGTANLMNAFLETHGENPKGKLFFHVSTDEVYGSLDEEGFFTENSRYSPRSPYAVSKAAADQLVKAYGNTYRLPYIISNCSNNYGPNQFPEKLIPLVIHNIRNKKDIPIYGDGLNIRDWLYVQDHVDAIDLLFHKGTVGEIYLIGGENEKTNLELVQTLCDLTGRILGYQEGEAQQLITFVPDRKGHDKRYAIDIHKISSQLGWKPKITFREGIKKTIDWYLNNTKWLNNVTSGEYKEYYRKMYEHNEG